jgi:hypothetical protein
LRLMPKMKQRAKREVGVGKERRKEMRMKGRGRKEGGRWKQMRVGGYGVKRLKGGIDVGRERGSKGRSEIKEGRTGGRRGRGRGAVGSGRREGESEILWGRSNTRGGCVRGDKWLCICICMGVWLVVAMDSLKFHPGPQCPTFATPETAVSGVAHP